MNKLKRSLLYLWVIIKHKWFFIVAARGFGLSFKDRLFHDWSKFSREEFGPYRDFFHPEGEVTDEIKDAFDKAWEHHWLSNEHHWQVWIDYPMPLYRVREMIVDWLAAGRAYTNSWDISNWVKKEVPKMSLHDKTYYWVRIILADRLNIYLD
jgi:hypothetical protein